MSSWSLQDWQTAAIDPRLHLPSPNVFIPTDFSIRDLTYKVHGTSHSVLISPSAYRPLTCITCRNNLLSMSQRRACWCCSCFLQVQQPILIRSSPLSKLWYKPDTKFRMPKAYIQLHFDCPETNHTPETSVLTHIFTKLLVDYLNEYGKKFIIPWEIEVIVSSLDDCA